MAQRDSCFRPDQTRFAEGGYGHGTAAAGGSTEHPPSHTLLTAPETHGLDRPPAIQPPRHQGLPRAPRGPPSAGSTLPATLTGSRGAPHRLGDPLGLPNEGIFVGGSQGPSPAGFRVPGVTHEPTPLKTVPGASSGERAPRPRRRTPQAGEPPKRRPPPRSPLPLPPIPQDPLTCLPLPAAWSAASPLRRPSVFAPFARP